MRRYYEYELVEVLKWSDGDSFWVRVYLHPTDLGFGIRVPQSGETIDLHLRLYGINCPEVRGPTRPAGLAAALYTESWIQDRMDRGISVRTLKDKKGTGSFGRWLSQLWCGHECLNQDLLISGHAVEMR